MIVYLVYRCYDNDGEFEDYNNGKVLLRIFTSEDKAKEFIMSEPCLHNMTEGYADDEWKEMLEDEGVIRVFHEVRKYCVPHKWYKIETMEAE